MCVCNRFGIVSTLSLRTHNLRHNCLSWSRMPRLLESVHPTGEADATQAQRQHRWSLLGSILSAGAPAPSAPADRKACPAFCRLWHICVIIAKPQSVKLFKGMAYNRLALYCPALHCPPSNHRASSVLRHGLQRAWGTLLGATLPAGSAVRSASSCPYALAVAPCIGGPIGPTIGRGYTAQGNIAECQRRTFDQDTAHRQPWRLVHSAPPPGQPMRHSGTGIAPVWSAPYTWVSTKVYKRPWLHGPWLHCRRCPIHLEFSKGLQ